MRVHDLNAMLLHLLEYGQERFAVRVPVRDYRLTDIHGDVTREIFFFDFMRLTGVSDWNENHIRQHKRGEFVFRR